MGNPFMALRVPHDELEAFKNLCERSGEKPQNAIRALMAAAVAKDSLKVQSPLEAKIEALEAKIEALEIITVKKSYRVA